MPGRVIRAFAVVAVLVLAAAIVVSGWFYMTIRGHMTPPGDPAGQPSIATGIVADEILRPGEPRVLQELAWFDLQGLAAPPVSSGPWTRWWWPGGDVELPALRAQLDALHAAGFGGVEIQPFLSGMINVADDEDVMARVYSFDSPAYYATLNAAIDYAHGLGMQVDVTNASGWPPGGPQINLQDSPTIMAYGETSIAGGRRVSVELPRPRPGAADYLFSMLELAGADFMNFPVKHASLLSVLAARVDGGERSQNPFNLVDTVNLDPQTVVLLTDKVDDGVLHWQAPEGEWRIVASYLLPSGEVPMGAAQKPQGFVVDHLRRPQVLGQYEYAFGEATGLTANHGRGMRGIFNDSLEFRLRRMSSQDILAEFWERRGYDLEPWLPVLYIEGVDNVYFREIMGLYAEPEFRMGELDERIRHDYQQTLSDLVIERFIETSARWAEGRGLTSRGQSYGMDLDIIRGLGANTIPETEQLWAGGANVGLKFASSAAALYGRPLVSAESFVWINRDYTPAARRLKAAADKLFLAGINHIVYHGTPYRWHGSGQGEYGEEGWTPFSGPQNPAHFSGNFSPANTAVWPDMPDLNAYIARSQQLLRQGAPAIDVLVYYPFLGFHGPNRPDGGPEALVNGSLPDADPAHVPVEAGVLAEGKKQMAKFIASKEHVDPRVQWVEALQPLLHELDQRGVTWAWVNDHALQSGRAVAGSLRDSGGVYRALLLADIPSLDPDTLSALRAQLDAGVPVIFAGGLPSRQRSFHNAAAGDKAVGRGVAQLVAGGAEHFASGDKELRERLLALSSATLRKQGSGSIHRQRRALAGDSEVHFFANQSADAAAISLSADAGARLWWFDAMTGRAWQARPVGGVLRLSLSGFDSRFLVAGMPMPAALAAPVPPVVAMAADGERQDLADWEMTFSGARLAHGKLADWREIEELRYAHGPVTYRHEVFVSDIDPGARYVLDLGLVQGSANVIVNGRSVGRASLPPFALDIGSALRSGPNTIEVNVVAPLRNLFLGRAAAGDPLYANMLELEGQLVAAGLLGPVTLHRVPGDTRS